MGGANAALESHRQIKKQTSILENRLDKALQKYNETLAQNKSLRREIDSLRQERLGFERQYGKMDKELQGIKQQMADVIEAANEAYEIRDNAEFHTAEIREEMDREKAEFKALLAEVDTRIAEEAQRVQRMDEMTKGALTASEEAQLQEELAAGQRKVELTRAKVARAADKIAYYEEAFSKIKVCGHIVCKPPIPAFSALMHPPSAPSQASTGITDIKQLVATFLRNEEENFSLFNFIAEQNAEIERLEEELDALREDGLRAQRQRGGVVAADRSRLKPLLDNKQQLEAATEALEARFHACKELVAAVCAGVQQTFSSIGCDGSAIAALVADASVTEGSAMQFLGVIEQRITEVLQQLVATSMELQAEADAGRSIAGSSGVSLPHASSSRPASASAASGGGDSLSGGGYTRTRPSSAMPAAQAASMAPLLGTGTGPRWRHGALASVRVQAPELKFFGGDSDEEAEGGAPRRLRGQEGAKPLSIAELKRMTKKDVRRFQRNVGVSLVSTPAEERRL